MIKYKRYERYKDSGVEWIGKIPEEWNVVRLKFLKAKPFLYGANESADIEERDFPRFIRITDIDSNGNLRKDIFKSLPWETAKPYLLKEGDVLFARSGATVGKTFIYKKSLGPACFAGYLIKFEANINKVIPNYVYYFTLSWQYDKWVKQSTIQATIQNVSAEKYGNLFVPLPSIQQQKMIVRYIDQKTAEIDDLIADKEKLIELLQEKRQAIITEAVTKGLNPNVRMKDSGIEWIGEIPEHWEVKPLKRIFKIVNGGTPSSSEESYWNGEIVWVTPNDLSKLTETCIVDSERKITEDGLHNCSARIVPKDSIVISTRAPIGYVAIAGVPLCTNQGCKCLVPTKVVNYKYYYYWMLSISFYLNVLGQGTTFMELSNDSLSMVELLIPSISEQGKISNYLDRKTAEIDALVTEIKGQIQKLKEYRQSLISEAVTGKIDVRDYIVD